MQPKITSFVEIFTDYIYFAGRDVRLAITAATARLMLQPPASVLAVNKKCLYFRTCCKQEGARATYSPNAKIVIIVKGSQSTLGGQAGLRDNRLWLAYLELLIGPEQSGRRLASVVHPRKIAPNYSFATSKNCKKRSGAKTRVLQELEHWQS